MSFVHLVSRSSPKDARFQQEPYSMYSIPLTVPGIERQGKVGESALGYTHRHSPKPGWLQASESRYG